MVIPYDDVVCCPSCGADAQLRIGRVFNKVDNREHEAVLMFTCPNDAAGHSVPPDWELLVLPRSCGQPASALTTYVHRV